VFGNGYGTPAEPVRKAIEAGRTIVLDIDVQGALQVHRQMPAATFVLIAPPSDQALRQRLGGRGSENEQEAHQRWAAAAKELETARRSGIYTHTVINDDLEMAVRAMAGIVQEESRKR
jgi:guanylate kinase